MQVFYFLSVDVYSGDERVEHLRFASEPLEIIDSEIKKYTPTFQLEPIYKIPTGGLLKSMPATFESELEMSARYRERSITMIFEMITEKWGHICCELPPAPGELTPISRLRWPVGDYQVELRWDMRVLLLNAPLPESYHEAEAALAAGPQTYMDPMLQLREYFGKLGVNVEHPAFAIFSLPNSGYAIRFAPEEMPMLRSITAYYTGLKSAITTLRFELDDAPFEVTFHGMIGRINHYNIEFPQLDGISGPAAKLELTLTPSLTDYDVVVNKIEAIYQSSNQRTLELRTKAAHHSGKSLEIASIKEALPDRITELRVEAESSFYRKPSPMMLDQDYSMRVYPISRRMIVAIEHELSDPFDPPQYGANGYDEEQQKYEELQIRQAMTYAGVTFSERAKVIFDGVQLIVTQDEENHARILKIMQRLQGSVVTDITLDVALDKGSLLVGLKSHRGRSAAISLIDRTQDGEYISGIELTCDNGNSGRLDWLSTLGFLQTSATQHLSGARQDNWFKPTDGQEPKFSAGWSFQELPGGVFVAE